MTDTIKKESRSLAKRPALLHYVPARNNGTGLELLHVTLGSGQEALLVFSSMRAAQSFITRNDHRREWNARKSYSGELISLLCGLYAGIEWVLLDPLPENLESEDAPPNLMRWDNFVDYLLG